MDLRVTGSLRAVCKAFELIIIAVGRWTSRLVYKVKSDNGILRSMPNLACLPASVLFPQLDS